MSSGHISGADAEIALTALLAAAVSAYKIESVEIYPLIQLISIGLLFLTLFRRMAVMEGASHDSRLIKYSTYILNPGTYIPILYLNYAFLSIISSKYEYLPDANILFVFATPVVIFLGTISWELSLSVVFEESEDVLRDSAEEHQGELLGGLISGFADLVQADRVYQRDSTNQRELSYYAEGEEEKVSFEELDTERQWNVIKHHFFTFVGILIALTSYVVLIWLSGHLFPGSLAMRGLLLLSVVLLSGVIRLWYSLYGIGNVFQGDGGFLTFFGDALTFIILCQIVLV